MEWLPVSDRGIYSALMPWVFWPAALRASTGPYRLLPLWKVGLWWQINLSTHKATYTAVGPFGDLNIQYGVICMKLKLKKLILM